MAKIYYIGDWAVQTGPVFAETPFNYAHKGLDIYNYGHWLKDALESTGRHEVESVPTWDFYMLPPGKYEEILDEYDVIIFSDVEAKNFQLAPSFFDRKKFGTKTLTFPDRVRLTVEAVEEGMSAMFLGGWLSFTGELGKGGWRRTGLSKILPVDCLVHEDLVESTEGFYAQETENTSRVFQKTNFKSFKPILGYNKTLPNDSGDVILQVRDAEDPLVATGEFGKGKVLTYMSDPAPHWGCNFVYWEDYTTFWIECLNYILD